MAPPLRPPMKMEEWAAGIADLGDSTPSVNLILYGPPGCGKTSLSAFLPRSLLLACDPGWVTAKARGAKCRIRPVRTYDELMAGVRWLENGGHADYDWIVVDGVTILQDRLTQGFARDAYEANPEKRVSPEQPDKPDYFRQQSALKSAVGRLCDLPANVVLTFHATIEDDDQADTWIRPAIAGRDYNVGNYVTGMVTSIGYMHPKTEGSAEFTRILWRQVHDPNTDRRILAKDQLGVFPKFMRVDDFELSAQTLNGLINGEEPAPEPQAASAVAPAPAPRKVAARRVAVPAKEGK